jgi:hypothetical protein
MLLLAIQPHVLTFERGPCMVVGGSVDLRARVVDISEG